MKKYDKFLKKYVYYQYSVLFNQKLIDLTKTTVEVRKLFLYTLYI